jgi:hypothetical protein
LKLLLQVFLARVWDKTLPQPTKTTMNCIMLF